MKSEGKCLLSLVFFLIVSIILVEATILNESNETVQTSNGENNETNESSQKIITKIIDFVIIPAKALIGEVLNISAILVYENESPISDKQVLFYSDGEILGENTTNQGGFSSINLNSSSYDEGEHNISVRFDGDENLLPSNASQILIIESEEKEELQIDKSNESIENIEVNQNITLESKSLFHNLNGHAVKISDEDRTELELTKRGKNFNKFINLTNNQEIFEFYPAPINYFNGEEYEPINTTILYRDHKCDLEYCVRDGIYYADFRENLGDWETVRFYFNGSNVSYTPKELKYVNSKGESETISEVQYSMAESEENRVIYPNVYGNGVNLKYEYHNTLLKEGLILDSASSLPSPTINGDVYLALEFELNTNDDIYTMEEGLLGGKSLNKWNKQSKKNNVKGLHAKKKNSDELAFYIPTPYAIDGEEAIELNYVIKSEGDKIIVTVLTPYDWLASNNRSYPIEIDPSTSTLDAQSYGVVSKSSLNVYSFYNYLYHMAVGEDSSNILYRSYARWILTSSIEEELDGAMINALNLYWYDTEELGSGDTVYFHSIDEDYPNDLTPNNQGDMQDLFNKIDDDLIGTDSSPDEYMSNSISLDEDIVENSLENNEDLIIGFSGIEDSSLTKVDIGPPNSIFEPFISVSYSCIQSNPICQGCLDLSDGEECDCNIECDSGICNNNYCVPTLCGNGEIDAGEMCDDGGREDDDGCSSTCYVENGWICSGEPSTCEVIESGCDDNEDCPSDFICESGYCIPEESCYGKINVMIVDSNENPIEDQLKIYLNDELYGLTEEGYMLLRPSGSSLALDCGVTQEIQIRCNDDTVCDTQYTSIDTSDDYDSLTFECDMCKDEEDLFISSRDISFENTETNEIKINAKIHNTNIYGENIAVKFRKKCNSENYEAISTEYVSFSGSGTQIVNTTSDLEGCSFVDVQINYNDSNGENNKAETRVVKPVSVYANIDTGYSYVDEVIEDYLDNYVDLVESSGEAEVILYVGSKYAPLLGTDGSVSYEGNTLNYFGEKEGLPYNGVVVKQKLGEKVRIIAFGNEIDGTISALRELIENRTIYLNKYTLNDNIGDFSYLAEDNIDAISVYDYFHTDENVGQYNTNTIGFANSVGHALTRETFHLAIHHVKTTNDDEVVLRMKHVNSEMSPEFQQYNQYGDPVVIAGGVWSNLFTHEWLGQRLVWGLEIGTKDTWLIELTGGPNTECDTCPNYNMTDLTDFYFPAYVAGVQAYTEKDEIDFVGFSNGCGVGLRSLDKYQEGGKLNAGYYINPTTDEWELVDMGGKSVSKFVGVGCPGAFEGDSLFKGCLDSIDNEDFFNELNSHVNKSELSKKMTQISIFDSFDCYLIRRAYGLSEESNQISSNLIKNYYNIIKNDTDSQPGSFDAEKSIIIYGIGGANSWGDEPDDGMVTKDDALGIASNLGASTKEFRYDHGTLIYGGKKKEYSLNGNFPFIKVEKVPEVYNYIIREGLK